MIDSNAMIEVNFNDPNHFHILAYIPWQVPLDDEVAWTVHLISSIVQGW